MKIYWFICLDILRPYLYFLLWCWYKCFFFMLWGPGRNWDKELMKTPFKLNWAMHFCPLISIFQKSVCQKGTSLIGFKNNSYILREKNEGPKDFCWTRKNKTQDDQNCGTTSYPPSQGITSNGWKVLCSSSSLAWPLDINVFFLEMPLFINNCQGFLERKHSWFH